MRADKRRKLEAGGWKTGSVEEFLGLTSEEAAYLEMKLALSRALKTRRQQTGLNQTELARMIRSSQSRIAKMEAGDPGVSIDLLMKALLALGTTPEELAKAIATSPRAA